MIDLDNAKILTDQIKQTITPYLAARPPCADTLREVLIALVGTAGVFLCPDEDAELRTFFDLILMQEIEDRTSDGLDIPKFLRREAPAQLPATYP